MSAAALYIRHPFLLAEGLKIALESTQTEMAAERRERLYRMIDSPESIGELVLAAGDSESRIDLLDCLRLFRQSIAWRWLRSDLIDALTDFERTVGRTQGVK